MEPYAPDIVYCYAGCMHEDTGEISKKEQARYGGVPGGLTGVANELVFLKWRRSIPKPKLIYTTDSAYSNVLSRM